MEEIRVPRPAMSDYSRAQIATENAFHTLVTEAKSAGLEVSPVMGLMYLPDQKLTRDFQMASRAILMALTPPGTHVLGDDGIEDWRTS